MSTSESHEAGSRMLQTKPVSDELLSVIPTRGVVLTAGGIGSGKSCLNYGIVEAVHLAEPERPCFAFGFPREKVDLLPEWIIPTYIEDFQEGAAVLADEAYMSFYSKDHADERNKFMDKFAGLARQKGILCLYITQTTRKLSLALVSGVQVFLVKCPDIFMSRLDRSELRPLFKAALDEYRQISDGDGQRATYVVSKRYEGLMRGTNQPPSFWTEELSEAWKGVAVSRGGEVTPLTAQAPSKYSCIECFGPAAGVCPHCSSSFCDQHMESHKEGSSGKKRSLE